MSIVVSHAFQSAKADGADTAVVRPGDWNAQHVVTVIPTTSYLNPGGSGDRSGVIIVTTSVSFTGPLNALVRGGGADSVSASYFNGDAVAGKYLRWDFGQPILIDEAIFRQSHDGVDLGVWKWQGSNDATAWTDIGGSFTNTGKSCIITTLHNNSASYRYYQMMGVSGSVNNTPFVFGAFFRTAIL